VGVVDIGRKTGHKKTMFSTPIFNKTASKTKSLIVQGDFDKIVDIDRTLKVSRKCFICMESFPCYGIFPLPSEMLGIERFENGEENDLSIYHKSIGTFP
jgi:DNA topoisomerase IB